MRIVVTKPQFVRALLAVLVAVIAGLLYRTGAPTVSVFVELRSATISHGEVFFTADAAGYSPTRRAPFDMVPDGSWHRYEIALPSGVAIDRIRLDPGSGPGTVEMRSAELRYGRDRYQLDGIRLREALDLQHQVKIQPGRADTLIVTSLGVDPYFELRLPQLEPRTDLARLRDPCLIAAAAFAIWMLLELAAPRVAGWFQRRYRFSAPLRRLCIAISDPAVLVVNTRILLAVASLALLAVLYVALRLNQSSIGIWDSIYPSTPVPRVQEPFSPKRIRADEWKVLTPWILNQVVHGSPISNQNVGGEDSPLLAAVPVDDALEIPQVKFAGFRFLGVERGMSWWWAYKSFGLVFSFLWLCLLLTRGDLTASLIGTAWVYASSFTQWWFSSNMPEIMIAFALGTVGAIYAVHASKRRLMLVGCVLVFYAAANLLLHLYPPFIIPLAYLALAILVGHAIEHRARGLSMRHVGLRAAAITVTCVALAAYAAAWATAAADTIHAMTSTVYPGQRISASGGVPFLKVVSGFFEPFRFDESHFPPGSSNASEASSFVLLWPLILLVMPWRALAKRDAAMLATLCCFGVLTACWIAVDIPHPIERCLQLLGWALVTPKRAVLAFGIGSILSCVVLFARARNEPGSEAMHFRRDMGVVVLVSCVAWLGWELHQADPEFFTWEILLAGLAACSLTSAGIALGQTRLLVAGLAIYALATITVNPLARGISSISAKPILLAAKHAGGRAGDRWMSIGDTTFTQGLKAQGLEVFAGSQFLPDRNSLAILDPAGAYRRIWNRYATVRVDSEPNREKPVFKLIYGDRYAIRLDVCGPQPRQLGITHVAYTVAVPLADLRCLQPLPSPPGAGAKLFRLLR